MTTDLFRIKPPVLAHRGLSGSAPENTAIAFTKAAQSGAKWVEFDVKLTSCYTPIIFHDDSLLRTTGVRQMVADSSYDFIRSLDAGSWFAAVFAGERVPTLASVLEWLVETNMNANIEIKPNPGEDVLTVDKTLPLVYQYFPHPTSRILFSSFSVESLRAIRNTAPDAQLGYLMHDWNPSWQAICDELQCVAVNIHHEEMTPARAQAIKSTGRQILCYTVNSTTRAQALYEMGVDAVFSDNADKLISYINKNEPLKVV